MRKGIKLICMFTVTLLLLSPLCFTNASHQTIANAANPDTGIRTGTTEFSNPLLNALTDLAKRIRLLSGISQNSGDSTSKWRLAGANALPHVTSMQHLKTLLNASQADVDMYKRMPEDAEMFAIDAPNTGMNSEVSARSAMETLVPALPIEPMAPMEAPLMNAEESISAEVDMGMTGGGGSSDFSQTNVQVAGVDEGDLVKTDGEYIYSLSGGKLYINKVNKGIIENQSTIDTELDRAELYLSGNKLVVAGNRYEGGNRPVPVGRAISDMSIAYYPGKNLSSYKVYDITNKTSPSLRQTFELEGNSAATRVIGDTLYFVINKYINYYYGDDSELVPTFRDTKTGAELKSLPVESIAYFPDSEQNNTYMIVGAMDLSEEREVIFQTYLNDSANFYMNMDSLYITRSNWRTGNTSIYRFKVTPQSVDYISEGSVAGTVLNQYSMDEHKGYFRIATTGAEGNRITIFDRSLNQVGKTPELAKGESIQSVRFMGDIAYMVTYLQTDPLYSVDLSDPYSPVVLDELKIPGFSTYLHPVEGDWLVGFGRHTTDTFFRDDSGREIIAGTRDMGQKVSLFDISDPKRLKEVDVMMLGENTWSEAFNNPKALMVDPVRRQFGFFMDGYSNYNSSTVIRLIGVNDGRLKDLGSITCSKGAYSYDARLLYIGDTLYAVFGGYLVAYDYNSLREIGKAGELRSYEYPIYLE